MKLSSLGKDGALECWLGLRDTTEVRGAGWAVRGTLANLEVTRIPKDSILGQAVTDLPLHPSCR